MQSDPYSGPHLAPLCGLYSEPRHRDMGSATSLIQIELVFFWLLYIKSGRASKRILRDTLTRSQRLGQFSRRISEGATSPFDRAAGSAYYILTRFDPA